MSPAVRLERLGFDPARLRFALRTALAACCAVVLAWLLGLEHPQWSGMTVWAASLPVRGHLLEKGLFRALGTVAGSAFGMGLLLAAGNDPWWIVTGLALWLGLCAGAGNLLRGFASYGAILAGYSAAMVALLHSARWASPLAIGIDRMLTVLVGVAVALALGWIFAAATDPADPARRARDLSARLLAAAAAHLAGRGPRPAEEDERLLSGMAAIEDGLDSHAAGSLRSRAMVRSVRRLLSAQVALLLWMRRPPSPGPHEALAAALREAADDPAPAPLQRAAALAGNDPLLREALTALAAAAGEAPGAGPGGVPLHRDWVGAREAMLRAVAVNATVGALWLATGWEAGVFMLLGTAIMTTVFSTADQPTRILPQVLLGQAIGIAAALACRWLAWPLAGGEAGLVALMLPFILAGGVLFGHRRGSGPVGFDANMVLLLLLQPSWPLAGSLEHSLTVGAAVLLGPAIGLLAFHLVFPVDGRRRLRMLSGMMVREVEAMAARRGASLHRPVWRARLYHRVLRLVRWAEKTGTSRAQVAEGGFALLLLGSAVLHLDEVLREPGLEARVARPLALALARLRQVGTQPGRAARALRRAADRLAADPRVDTALLREAAAELSGQAGFIGQAAARHPAAA
ncbi:FUSC family protein [Roseomonas sp. OT10]|uniref:FUSC family protein n=1 Tax=Roseomonas cutis TaxID=2897332 RepID=UPI001E5DF57E|nr:FUSC family protein [Roseomonas sp. OT10]UFN50155.1 FUSC family protein [Roseomonas sp. OT10]